MSQQDKMTDTGGHSVQDGHTDGGRRVRRLRRLVIILIVFVLAAVAVVYVRSNDSDETAGSPKDERSEVLKSVAEDDRRGDFTASAQKLRQYVESNPPSEYAETETVRLAATYANAKDYDSAISWYQKALDTYPGAKLAAVRGLAFVYMQRGDDTDSQDDYRKALDYFKQAITIEQADEASKHLVASDESNIRYLEGILK